ncbi:MAG: hypothetical protein ABSA02_23565 [Trebonia sp.]
MTEPPRLLVSAEFAVPAGLATELFVLEPLDVRHNESDYAAWTSSLEHIKATPGFGGKTWLDLGLSLEDNAADVRSWTRADRAHLDKPLHDTVTEWLAAAWPFECPDYAARKQKILTIHPERTRLTLVCPIALNRLPSR